MNRVMPPIASTVLAACVLLSSVIMGSIGIKEGPTLLGLLYELEAVTFFAGWFPMLVREAIQDWREYGRGGDE